MSSIKACPLPLVTTTFLVLHEVHAVQVFHSQFQVSPFYCLCILSFSGHCILKAESCAGVPTKKKEKYARHEDAILHALEIEKLQLDEKNSLVLKESTWMKRNMPLW